MLTANELEYVHLRAEGKTPAQAYKLLHPGSSEESAKKNARRFEDKPEVQALLQEYFLVDKTEVARVRREVVARCMMESRDESIPVASRLKAREMVMKIYGLDKTQVEVSTDEAFRKFLMGQN